MASKKFYSIRSSKILQFFDGNGRTYQILFANDDTIVQNIGKFKLYIKRCYRIV